MACALSFNSFNFIFCWVRHVLKLSYGIYCLKATSRFNSNQVDLSDYLVNGVVQVAVAIVISWLIFKNPISFSNAIGCSVTLIGCTFYGYVRHRLSQQASTKASSDAIESVQLLPLVNEERSDRA